MYCPKCGNNCDQNLGYCKVCGHAFGQVTRGMQKQNKSTTSQEEFAPVKIKNTDKKTAIIAICISMVILVVLGLGALHFKNEREKRVADAKASMLKTVKDVGKWMDEETKSREFFYDDYVEADEMTWDVVRGELGYIGAYVYIVDNTGIMLYHPDMCKIGNPVENSVVKGLVAEMEAGRHPEPGCVKYEYKDSTKYAAYYVGEDESYIVVLTADESEIIK